MRPAPVLLALTLLVAGCAGRPGPERTTDEDEPTPTPPPPPKELVSEVGNARCMEVLTGNRTFDFQVEDRYDRMEVSFHASGLGRVGYEVRGPNDTLVTDLPDYNPANQPCSHAHEGNITTFTATPGAYRATVRQLGLVGWHLQVNERASQNNTTAPGHHPS